MDCENCRHLTVVGLHDTGPCSDKCCHTKTKVADTTFYLTQSQHTDTWIASPSTRHHAPGRVATGVPVLKSLVWKKTHAESENRTHFCRSPGGRLTTRPARLYSAERGLRSFLKDRPAQLFRLLTSLQLYNTEKRE